MTLCLYLSVVSWQIQNHKYERRKNTSGKLLLAPLPPVYFSPPCSWQDVFTTQGSPRPDLTIRPLLRLFWVGFLLCTSLSSIEFQFMWGCNVSQNFVERLPKKELQELERKWPHSEALITQLDQRDADCDFTIRPTRHRLRLNQPLPCTIALHNAFQQPAPNPQSDTNETVAGWTEGPKTLFLEAQRPLWSPVEPWSPLHCGDHSGLL